MVLSTRTSCWRQQDIHLDRLCLWQREERERRIGWIRGIVGSGDGYIHAGAREVAPVGWAMRMFLRIKAPAYGLQAGLGGVCCAMQGSVATVQRLWRCGCLRAAIGSGPLILGGDPD